MRRIATMLTFTILAIAAGCKSTGSTAGQVVAERSAAVGGAIERIDTRASFITAQAKQLPTSPPKVIIVEQSALIHDDAEEARSTISKLNTATAMMDGTIRQVTAKNENLEARVVVYEDAWVGPKTRRLFDRVILGIVIFGITGIVLGIVSPAGIGMVLSRLINANIFAPFVVIRDTINKRRGWKTETYKEEIVAVSSPTHSQDAAISAIELPGQSP